MNTIGLVLFGIFCLFLFVMYVKNLILLKDAVQVEDYSLVTIARVIGAFMPLVGIFMGFIKNVKSD